MLGILISVLVFGLIVLIHETGHFIRAKKCGITVLEFSVGMGPRIFCFRKGETTYSMRAFPIGGACVLLGEEEEVPAEGAFHNKGIGARMSVVAAGPGFNFLFALFLAVLMICIDGYSVVEIKTVEENSAASDAGLLPGDIITSVNGERMTVYNDYLLYTILKPNEEIKELQYERISQETKEKTSGDVHLTLDCKDEYDRCQIGITIAPARVKSVSLGTVLKYGLYEVKYNIAVTIKSLGMILKGEVGMKDLAGPVGITAIIDDSIKAGLTVSLYGAIINVMSISIFLSTNLGIMNLLPIPVLDGGRIMLLGVEAVRGKPLNRKVEKMICHISMVVLLIIMLIVVFFDVRRLFL